MWGFFVAGRFITCAEENNAQKMQCVYSTKCESEVCECFSLEIENRVERIWTIVAQ